MNANPLFNLSGKTALVTGSNTGLGQAMAVALAGAGANVVGTVRNEASGGNDTAEAVRNAGVDYHQYTADLGDRDALYRFIADVKTAHTIDILINNAGTIMRQPAAEHPDEWWDAVMRVNLDAQFILAREFGKAMIDRGGGKIIFICSLLSFQGGINVPGYTASKAAVAGLVKAFSNEWSSKGVNVNGIAPGYMDTNNTKALKADPDRNASILSRIPAGRWGLATDMTGPVVFLASEASNYVHGHILVVDGGWMGR